MASANPARGRGRARPLTTTAERPPPPSVTASTSDSSASPVTDISVTSPIPSTTPATPTNETGTPDTGFSSAPSPVEVKTVSSTPVPTGRGRGRGGASKSTAGPTAPSISASQIKDEPEMETDDPYYKVSDLTKSQFYSNARASKPNELGTLGNEIRVVTNFFPVTSFPQSGIVYQYSIRILDRRNAEIHRDRRRALYKIWLNGFCRQYPDLSRDQIVFDNQGIILSLHQELPGIDEYNNFEAPIIGPSRGNRQVPHKVIVQYTGNPIDLNVLQNLNQFYENSNASNTGLEELARVKQVLSIVMHEHCSSEADFIFNRTFFNTIVSGQRGEWDLGLGKAMWRGFYSCLVFGKGANQLLMNLDIKHTVFMKKQPFLDFVCEVMMQSPMGKNKYGRDRGRSGVEAHDVLEWLDPRNPMYQESKRFLEKQCKDLRVKSQDADKPIVYTIKHLGASALEQTFEWSRTKEMISVNDYYQRQYNSTLQFPQLPTLSMSNKSFVPMEKVDVEPVRVKKITDDQRAALCRATTMKPNDYQNSIKGIRKNPKQQRFEADPFVVAWNLNVDPEMIVVKARVLPMPEIVYNAQVRITPDRVRNAGTWDAGTTKFFEPQNFPNTWGMINLSSLRKHECEEFFYELKGIAQSRGMTCDEPTIYEEYDVQRQSIERTIFFLRELLAKNPDCRFFIVILPRDTQIRKHAYTNLKRLWELAAGIDYGIPSQMLKEENARRGSRKDPSRWDLAKLSNILLKINPKLNGTNSRIKVPDEIGRFFSRGHRVMYVGADLSHLGSHDKGQVSAVAVVASADDIPNRYFKEIYKQERSGQARNKSIEHIIDMKSIMKSLIAQYERYRGFPPNAIVIYRDGISEGEFDSVFVKELTSIREACTELSTAYRPYLSYIVVSKRHHTRFFPTDPRATNVEAGTVVDAIEVTNAVTYDFYLNSQHGALGTSRPTHYHVLYDDNKLKPNEVQMLTYALCYTYARCTRSVAIPAPVKYADLLALRAAFYIKADDQSDTESVASGGSNIPPGQPTSVDDTDTKSERVVLSSKLMPECPFFL